MQGELDVDSGAEAGRKAAKAAAANRDALGNMKQEVASLKARVKTVEDKGG